MRPLTALLITDDRPGHYHLSEGILAAARRIRPVEVIRLRVTRRWSPHALAAMWNAGLPARWLLRLAYGLDAAALPKADFVVSAGAETLTANVAAGRILAVPNLFYGSLRWFPADSFALVLTSYAENAGRPRHVMMIKPSSIALTNAHADIRFGVDRPPATAGLLVGGDTSGFRYTAADWQYLLAFLDEFHRVFGTRWLVTNSRRTPAEASDALKAKAAAGSAIGNFVDVRTAGAGTLGGVLETSEVILCTDDSSSMISESVAARRPVVGIRPAQSAFTSQEAGYRRHLSDSNWYRSIAIADLTPSRLLAELATIQPLSADPLDQLATVLRERLPDLFDR